MPLTTGTRILGRLFLVWNLKSGTAAPGRLPCGRDVWSREAILLGPGLRQAPKTVCSVGWILPPAVAVASPAQHAPHAYLLLEARILRCGGDWPPAGRDRQKPGRLWAQAVGTGSGAEAAGFQAVREQARQWLELRSCRQTGGAHPTRHRLFPGTRASLHSAFSRSNMAQGGGGAYLSRGLQCLGPETGGLGPCWGAWPGFRSDAKAGLARALCRSLLST